MAAQTSILSRLIRRPNAALQNLLRPRATDRDAAFRERIVRSSLFIAVVGALLSFASTLFIFRSEWALISFPTVHVALLALCFAAALAVYRGRMAIASWLLVAVALVGASGILALALQAQLINGVLLGVLPFFFAPLFAAMLLPARWIIPVSIITGSAYGLVHFSATLSGEDTLGLRADQQVVSVFLFLVVASILLRQLRLEFDARLQAMSAAIQEAEAARQQAETDRERAERADRTKSQFLANMSHELRTPMNAIIGYDEAMLAGMVGDFQPRQIELLRYIQTNGRRLLALINDILDLAKIESGKTELYLVPMRPHLVIGDTVASLQSLAAEKALDLRVTFAAELPGVLMGDAKKIEQIVVNLVSNAIKFTDSGSVLVEVADAGPDRWQFSVRDTGIGISPDAQETVFDPFHQADNTPTRKYKGTGLGLSITRHLVERMGGTITLVSAPDQGSVFTVVLPVFAETRAAQPASRSAAEAPPAVPAQRS